MCPAPTSLCSLISYLIVHTGTQSSKDDETYVKCNAGPFKRKNTFPRHSGSVYVWLDTRLIDAKVDLSRKLVGMWSLLGSRACYYKDVFRVIIYYKRRTKQ